MPAFLTSIACNVLDRILVEWDTNPTSVLVAFIPTASNPSENKEGTDNDRAKLVDLGFRVIDVDIAAVHHKELRKALNIVDMIFVGGGNTFYLLQEARRSGFDEILTELLFEDKPYIGSSAGSVLLAPNIEPIKLMDDPKDAPELESYSGLKLIDFLPLVHFGNEAFADEYRHAFVELYSSGQRFVPVRDDEFLLVKNDYWRICS